MAGHRIPGVLGYPPSQQQTIDPFTRQPFSQPGTLNSNLEHQLEQEREIEKKEIALDICQFILDMTGIIDPTPASDGTNAIISLSRGRWIDAVISVVSIVPYVGDIAKLGKLPRYLASIRKAIRIARADVHWSSALKKLFIPLKKVIDQLYELGANKLPQGANKTLQQIKHEIDKFLKPASGGTASSETVGDLIASNPKNTRPKIKQRDNTPSKPRNKNLEEKPKEVVSSEKESGIIGGNGVKDTDGVPDKVTRSDENFPSKTTKKGGGKAYTDKDGNLHVANPDGKTTIPEHIRNHKHHKDNSPHISTTAQDGNVKSRKYGDDTVEIDTKRLQKDIDSGKVKDVEIVPPKKVQGQVQKKIDSAQKKYDANPSKKNSDSLKNAKRDLENTTRDNECIITVTGKGCVPSEYIKKAK
jgi:hypothetical protein